MRSQNLKIHTNTQKREKNLNVIDYKSIYLSDSAPAKTYGTLKMQKVN